MQAAGIKTPKYAKKTDLASLKPDGDNTDISILLTTPINLSKEVYTNRR